MRTGQKERNGEEGTETVHLRRDGDGIGFPHREGEYREGAESVGTRAKETVTWEWGKATGNGKVCWNTFFFALLEERLDC